MFFLHRSLLCFAAAAAAAAAVGASDAAAATGGCLERGLSSGMINVVRARNGGTQIAASPQG